MSDAEKSAATAKQIRTEDEAKQVAADISRQLITLRVSLSTFNEIQELVRNSGRFNVVEDEDIDMTGFAIGKMPHKAMIDVTINGRHHRIPYDTGFVTYEEIRDLAFPDCGTNFYPTCIWTLKGNHHQSNGILRSGQSAPLEEGLNISIVDTGNA